MVGSGHGDPAVGSAPVPPAQRRAALELLDQLGDPEGPCHGDCFWPNVLFDGSRFWLIDARGVRGEIAFDLAMLAADSYLVQPERRARALRGWAAAAGVDPDRAVSWLEVITAARV